MLVALLDTINKVSELATVRGSIQGTNGKHHPEATFDPLVDTFKFSSSLVSLLLVDRLLGECRVV